jgi:glycosyltransferase involved in cell wall biosynthesis
MEQALTAIGVTIVTATTDHARGVRGPACEEIPCDAGKITRYYARKLTNFYKVAPGMIPWLWKNVRRFDAVHIHALFSFSSIAAALVAWFRGVPFIIRPLGTLTRYGITHRALLKAISLVLIEGPILRRAAAVHFTSSEEQDEARALKISMRGVVIPLGIESSPPGNSSRLEEAYPTLRGRTAVLFLSRLDPKKNVEALLDGFSLIAAVNASPILLIAGSGNPAYAQSLKNRARSLGIDDRIIWLGHIEGSGKQDALARADIFVLPSFSENFGIAPVEAMLAGLPCVLGVDVAVAKRAAAEGAAFAVVPRPDAIAGAIGQLLADPNLRREMGEKSRAHARRYYSAGAMATALKELYASLSVSTAGDAA